MTIKYYINAPGPLKNTKTLIIKEGMTARAIINKLDNENIINYPFIMLAIIRINNKISFQAGEYEFAQAIKPSAIINKLTQGDVVKHYVTLPEGFTNQEIIEKLNSISNLIGKINNTYKEGYLLPNTYQYTYGDTRQEIIDNMYKAMQNSLNTLWECKTQNLPFDNVNQVLTLASIIEKETSVENERNIIASVFVNRIRKNMRLQADPTVIYALTKGQIKFKRLLSKQDLKIKSPFNTYIVKGLPPTPIANPGLKAIEAALNPASTNYFYFVADGNGSHRFATNLKEHNRNTAIFRNIK